MLFVFIVMFGFFMVFGVVDILIKDVWLVFLLSSVNE